jgi:hypothetical protein
MSVSFCLSQVDDVSESRLVSLYLLMSVCVDEADFGIEFLVTEMLPQRVLHLLLLVLHILNKS